MADMHLSTIEHHRHVDEIIDDNIVVDGKIDDNCVVTLVSRRGNVVITGKIDNNCNVTLIAPEGNVDIGTVGDAGDRKIDNNCTVHVEARGHITVGDVVNNHCSVTFEAGGVVKIGGKVDDNSTVVIESRGAVTVGDKIDNNSFVEVRALQDVLINGKIDNNCDVTLDTLRGGITIAGKIDDNTMVHLSAAGDILIGTTGGSEDRHINNRCHVVARSGGLIKVGDKLGDDCFIQFRACGPITIVSVVERGCHAFFETPEGIDISVRKLRDNNTEVTYWGGRLVEAESRHESPTVRNERWVDAPLYCTGREVTGEWWQNWSWKYAYVADEKFLPNSLEELVRYVAALRKDKRTKAVGGGWSFTDASLPFATAGAVDFVSMEKRGIGGRERVRRLLEGAPGSYREVPFDQQPNTVVRDREASTAWNNDRLTNEVRSGFHLPAAALNTSIIDIRRLASSLQAGFLGIASPYAKAEMAAGRYFFHVEAGITMADLYVVLDHQKPRLAVQATGGSRGATLAGTMSTATHGGEFRWPLLIDRVKAIHLVGPGGVEWWIEGSESVADFSELSRAHSHIDRDHFIAGDWTHSECDEVYTAEDVLRAVTVAMGTIGVIYSVVLEVVPVYGLQQKVKRVGHWTQLLELARVSEAQLRARDESANQRLLDFILDGTRNGTGIEENVYVDVALNPITLESWITNRRVTPGLPRESKELDFSIGRYEKSFRHELVSESPGIFGAANDELVARLMDFLNYGRSISDVGNDIGQAARLISYVLKRPPLFPTLLSTANAQLVLNELFRSEPTRKRLFVGEILTGLLNVLKGTVLEDVSDITGLCSKVGATGFTDEGLPGKGLEIAFPPTIAFSFLQVILDRLRAAEDPPLIGYVALRVCPQTHTLMGMQQFAKHSVMIEPFAFRTPGSLGLIQTIMDDLARWNTEFNAGGMLHWGLENDTLDRARLEQSAVTRPYKSGSPISKLVAFKAIRAMILGRHPPVFDNYFVKRLGLDDYKCELREVTATRKRAGHIVALCNPGEPWRQVNEEQAIQDIRSRGIRYFMRRRTERLFVHVVIGARGPDLRTTPGEAGVNNLLELPDC